MLFYSALVLLCFTFSVSAQVSILTSNYTNERNNWNSSEAALTPSTVGVASFGKIGAFPVDGQIYTQPLYVSGLHLPGRKMPDVVYVATMHNSVYAFNADTPQSTAPLWQVNLGPSVPSSAIPNYSDIVPEIGILSTPVIDPTRQAIYVVAETFENGACVFRLHALSVQNGQEMFFGPAIISATAASNGGTVHFNSQQQLQRAGLALVNGAVYAGFGSHGDEGGWYGWLIGYNASDLRNQIAALNIDPEGNGGSIWQSGRAPAIDSDGNLYVVTANGDYDGQTDFGESFLKIATPSLSILDWYTPSDAAELSINDWDLGSSGAILIPELNLVTGAGKSGEFFALNQSAMGHQPARPGNERIQLSSGALFTAALWSSDQGTMLYLLDQTGPLFGFRIVNGQAQQTPFTETNPTVYTAFSGIAVSSNGSAAGTGIVWQTVGNTAISGTPGSLHAFAANDLTNELWNSDMVPGDALGRFAKFVAPTVADGHVYVPTFSNQLAIYGFRSNRQAQNTTPQIAGIVNGASLANQAVAPGEVVSLFGVNLAPDEPSGIEVNSAGNVQTQLSGTEVHFNGVPAPLLYTSSMLLTAVVPFGLQGPSATVQVENQALISPSVSFPVANAAPAIFAASGAGGGQASALNQDGSVNGFYNPAPPGSVVTLFATGAGQTTPPGVDGSFGAMLSMSVPILPVSVQIGGVDAQVLFAGQAPGQVAGVIQINAVVPNGPASGNVPVVLTVGGISSPSTVMLRVQ